MISKPKSQALDRASRFPEGQLDFGHYCAVHHHLFRLRMGRDAADGPDVQTRQSILLP